MVNSAAPEIVFVCDPKKFLSKRSEGRGLSEACVVGGAFGGLYETQYFNSLQKELLARLSMHLATKKLKMQALLWRFSAILTIPEQFQTKVEKSIF